METLDNIFETSIVLFQLNPFELYTLASECVDVSVDKDVFWWISSQQDPGSVFPLMSLPPGAA